MCAHQTSLALAGVHRSDFFIFSPLIPELCPHWGLLASGTKLALLKPVEARAFVETAAQNTSLTRYPLVAAAEEEAS